MALKVLDDHHRGEDQTARLRTGIRVRASARPPPHRHGLRVRHGWLTMELVDGGNGERAWPATRTGWPRWHRSPMRWTTHTDAASCTATSSRPTSLFRRTFPRAVLIDFGVAATRSPSTVWTIIRPSIEASLPYTAPELLRGRPPSAATDEYALACTAVELLTRCTAIHGRHADGTDGRPSQPARAELLAHERLAATALRLGAGQGAGEDPGQPL